MRSFLPFQYSHELLEAIWDNDQTRIWCLEQVCSLLGMSLCLFHLLHHHLKSFCTQTVGSDKALSYGILQAAQQRTPTGMPWNLLPIQLHTVLLFASPSQTRTYQTCRHALCRVEHEDTSQSIQTLTGTVEWVDKHSQWSEETLALLLNLLCHFPGLIVWCGCSARETDVLQEPTFSG